MVRSGGQINLKRVPAFGTIGLSMLLGAIDRDKASSRSRHVRCARQLAANYLAFVQLASIRLWLRVSESTA
jgi:hypothetical protein